MKAIGLRLKKYLSKNGISIMELSEMSDIPYNSLTRALNEERGMSSETLNKILDSFPTLNAEWLISGIGDLEKPSKKNESQDQINKHDTSSIGNRLKKVLEIKGVSYSDFSTKAEIHYNSVTRMMNSDRAMNSKTLSKIFSIFPDLNPRYLITGEGEMFKNETNVDNVVFEAEENYSKNDDQLLEAKLKAILTNPVMLDIIKEALKKYDESKI